MFSRGGGLRRVGYSFLPLVMEFRFSSVLAFPYWILGRFVVDRRSFDGNLSKWKLRGGSHRGEDFTAPLL